MEQIKTNFILYTNQLTDCLFEPTNQSGPLSLVEIRLDIVLWLVEPYYAGAKVYALTTHHTPQGK